MGFYNQHDLLDGWAIRWKIHLSLLTVNIRDFRSYVIRRCGLGVDKSNVLDNSRNTIPILVDVPAITTVTTVPGYAISDLDRDIKIQSVDSQEL